MSDPTGHDADTCREIHELAAWYPGGTLTDAERRSVERHAESCPGAADLLDFAKRTAQWITTEAEVHPEPQELVRLTEEPAALAAAEREQLRLHAAICADCAEELGILEQLAGADVAGPAESGEIESIETPLATVGAAGLEWADRLRDWWERWTGSLVRPAPAAVCMAAAVAVLLAVLLQPGGRDEILRAGAENYVGGVVLMPDRSIGLRGGIPSTTGTTVIAAAEPQVLLLELTELTEPPVPDARYAVTVHATTSGRPAWRAAVRGAAFVETYTLCLVLQAGTLEPGSYEVTVADSDGASIYRAPLTVR